MSAPPAKPPGDDSEGEVEPAMDDAATVATISRRARTAEKQARIEAALKSLPKGSKAYKDIVEGLREGSFRKSRSNREKARSLLTKEKSRLTERKLKGKSKQVKGNEAKMSRVDKLLPLLDSETNVEDNSGPAPEGSELEAVEGTSNESKSNAISTENAPVTIAPTSSDDEGDCFYSAIYRSLLERGLLAPVASCLSLDTEDEPTFIQSFRDTLADRVASGNLQYSDEKNGRIDTYDSICYFVKTYKIRPRIH
jgi:hypothetical protein